MSPVRVGLRYFSIGQKVKHFELKDFARALQFYTTSLLFLNIYRSEHERHSPLCPFVRCEPTLNVPIAITLARQPASPNPLLNHLRTRDNQIDFLCVGENSSLVVAASKVGNFIYWDASSGMPVVRTFLLQLINIGLECMAVM